jgi:CHAT domain-containing protein
MSWPPPGVDPALNETLLSVLTDAEHAQQSMLSIDRELNLLTEEKRRRVAQSLPVADLLPRADVIFAAARQAKQPVYAALAAMLVGEILLDSGCTEEALSCLETARVDWATTSGPDGGAPERAIDTQLLERLTRVHMARKDMRALSDTCGEAIEAIERDRYKASSPYLQSAFLKDRASLYSRGVGAAWQLGDDETMLARAELSKARSVLRMHYASAAQSVDSPRRRRFLELCDELRAKDPRGDGGSAVNTLLEERRRLWDLMAIDRLRAADGSVAPLPPFSLSAVQSALDPDEAVLYYYWLDVQVLLVVGIDRQRIATDHVVLNATVREALEGVIGAIRTFSGAMDPDTLCEFDRAVAACSPLWLPKKVVGLIEDKRRLIVSPHHKLHLFPFHAVWWESGFLIERFAVSYVPNLGVLTMPARPAGMARVLVGGVAEFGLGLKLPPLPAIAPELEGVVEAYRRQGIETEALAGGRLTRRGLCDWSADGTLAGFSTIHLATHGVSVLSHDVSDTPMESRLMLFDVALDGLEISTLQLTADLVVLSACNSGQRAIGGRDMDELPGDDVFGIQAAFAMAGACAVIGCLWPADDASAEAIMVAFHRHRAAAQAPEVALQSAVVDYIHRDGARHCYLWAPYFLSVVGPRDTPS